MARRNRVKVQGNQILPWRAKALPGELRRPNLLKANVAKTHWGSNANSPWRAYLAWRVHQILQRYISHFFHFRNNLIIILEREYGEN